MSTSPRFRRGAVVPPPVARHGQLRARHPLASALEIFAVTVAVLLVSVLAISAVAVYNIASAIKPGVALPGEADDAPRIGSIEGVVDLLLVGSDSGGGNPAYGERGEVLNDVTMLLHISKDHTRATVVSFPRDLFVDIPSCPNPDGRDFAAETSVKLNTALVRGGLACPVLTIQELSGLDIPFAAKIEFDGAVAMSNAVGGVEVCVATAIHDRQIDFDLEAGRQKLMGTDAVMFLRSRYGVGNGGDLTRISNQQQFLSSLVRTLKSSETLSNPIKLYGIASAASRNLEFSNSLRNVDTMVSIAGALKDIPLEDVVFVKYPAVDGTVRGQSGVLPVTSAADQLFAAIMADQPIVLTGGTGGGTVADPNAPTPTQGATPDPSASSSIPPGSIELPSAIEGQNASQETCTKGQTAGG